MGKRATSFYRQPLSVFCESVSLDWIVKKREKQKKKRGIDAFVADGNFHWLILPCWRYGVLALMCNMCQVTIIFSLFLLLFDSGMSFGFLYIIQKFLQHVSKIPTGQWSCLDDHILQKTSRINDQRLANWHRKRIQKTSKKTYRRISNTLKKKINHFMGASHDFSCFLHFV